jgi:hypothetical protein
MQTWLKLVLLRVSGVLALAAVLQGCANVAFDHGSTRLEEKSLVFGRMLLERDGERAVISTFSTPVVIRKIETADEPKLLTQSFEKDGSFYWSLPPGRYQVSLVLSPFSEGLRSYAFTVAKAGISYYFGDLVFAGKSRFNTLGGANIRNVEPRFEDGFDRAKQELLQKNSQLNASAVERLAVSDMANAKNRGALYKEALTTGRPCCQSYSQISYKRIAIAENQSAMIGPHSELFDFPDGRSRFVAWELPRSSTPYVIAMRSVVTPSALPGTGHFYIFAPAVMLLDGNFNVIANQERGIFAPVPATMFPPRSASLQGVVNITGNEVAPRYLIVYTTQSLIEGTLRTSMPGFVPIAGGVLPTGIPSPVWMEPAISGEIELALKQL